MIINYKPFDPSDDYIIFYSQVFGCYSYEEKWIDQMDRTFETCHIPFYAKHWDTNKEVDFNNEFETEEFVNNEISYMKIELIRIMEVDNQEVKYAKVSKNNPDIMFVRDADSGIIYSKCQ